HKIPLYKFKDGSHHASNDEMPQWNAYIESQLAERNIEGKLFFAKKGDVFIWHSDLLHAGSPIKDPNRTRNSLVCQNLSQCDWQKIHLDLLPPQRGFWYRRPALPIPPKKGKYRNGEQFPEEAYLARPPDVRAAVEAGHFKSGRDHFLAFGEKEG